VAGAPRSARAFRRRSIAAAEAAAEIEAVGNEGERVEDLRHLLEPFGGTDTDDESMERWHQVHVISQQAEVEIAGRVMTSASDAAI
jgi:hypothetical protein